MPSWLALALRSPRLECRLIALNAALELVLKASRRRKLSETPVSPVRAGRVARHSAAQGLAVRRPADDA